MSMKTILNHLFAQKKLTQEEAKEVLTNIAAGKYNDSEIAAFISIYLMRNISVEELAGFRDALLELCLRVDLSDYETIDLCGTGGDGKDTFNISTLSSFVVAGAGFKVAKHGNYGVSSICGSSNVLEFLGCKLGNQIDILKKSIEKANFCMMHAPFFHPALKNVAPIRRQLGVKTFFNMLGPMVNPAFPKYQMVGVFNLELARLYSYIYQQSDKQFVILHSLDGYDEISLTSPFKKIANSGEKLMDHKDLGLPKLKQEDLLGGSTVEESAKIFVDVLQNKGTLAQKSAVLANSAFAVQCFLPNQSLPDCVTQAKESLESGKAFQAFETFLEITKN